MRLPVRDLTCKKVKGTFLLFPSVSKTSICHMLGLLVALRRQPSTLATMLKRRPIEPLIVLCLHCVGCRVTPTRIFSRVSITHLNPPGTQPQSIFIATLQVRMVFAAICASVCAHAPLCRRTALQHLACSACRESWRTHKQAARTCTPMATP